MRRFIAVVVLRLAVGLVVGQGVAHAQTPDEVVTMIQDAAGRHGVSPARLVAVARCETGGTFNPQAVGDHGTSHGIFQLHSPGERDTFLRRGFTDPFNVWEASEFTAQRFAEGAARAWSCAR